ncbi:MAG: cofactor-independent phosphoglycerate mutase [Candidatus Latescibacteria bacterium]|nr:cofactor-independent phosphoglycerate mutase [Candidatus Latescibacterota bacterium]
MKYAILIGDGMADYPIDELGGRTPLEAAHTPNMDTIARQGVGGLVRTIPQGKAPGSDVANLEILGYDSKEVLTGRAPLEAASMRIELLDDEVAFRCNLITVEDGKILDYSAGHITTKEGTQLIAEIQERLGSHRVRFYPGVAYRHLMVMRDGPEHLETVPPHDVMGARPADHLPRGDSAAFIGGLMADSVEILKEAEVNRKRIAKGKLPATQIWLWGSGKALRIPALKDRFGATGGVISAVDLLKGIGISAGLRVIDVPGITGYLDTNYSGKAQYALSALKELDFVYVHVEAPDEASHNGSLKDKIRAIEDFDTKVVGPVLEGLRAFGNFRLMVLPDHRTPLSVRTHTPEPVPVAIYASDGEPDHMQAFSEPEAERGSLQLKSGDALIRRFFQSP